MEAGIRHALGTARTLLPEHARVELVSFEMSTGVALLAADGGCADCELSVETLATGIEAHLRHRVPELRAIRVVTN